MSNIPLCAYTIVYVEMAKKYSKKIDKDIWLTLDVAVFLLIFG
jgi:hypothetical protein